MHKLYLNADFKIGDSAWSLTRPADYDVALSEPFMKASIDLPLLMQHVSIIVALQQAGILDWVRSKAYDTLWEYLKMYFQEIPREAEQTTADLKIKDQDGALRIQIDGITPGNLAGAKIAICDKLTRTATGDLSEEHTIVFEFPKHTEGQ